MKTINSKYRHKTASETYFGDVSQIEDIGDFINEAISEFKKSNVTPVSKVLIEIDEVFDGENEPYVMGFEIKVVNIDLHNEFKVGDIND